MSARRHGLSLGGVIGPLIVTLMVVCQGVAARAASRPGPQFDGGIITGQVSLRDGTIVQFCVVRLEGINVRLLRYGNSGARGVYRFENVPPGNYVVQGCLNRDKRPYSFRREVISVNPNRKVVNRDLHEGVMERENVGGRGRRRTGFKPCVIVTADYEEPLFMQPNKTVYVPLTVKNNCAGPDIYELRIEAPGGTSAITFDDTNSDRNHQDSEPPASYTRLLQPPKGAQFPGGQGSNVQHLLLSIHLPPTIPINQKFTYTLNVRSGTKKGTSGHTDIVVRSIPH